ncbi:MAG: hypothetical protein ABGX47_11070 [Martelella sp.]|uniref:hypothetical protein n=1 Tax=Martelella sp. TaxID=1969699 RepID=UPI003242EBA4
MAENEENDKERDVSPGREAEVKAAPLEGKGCRLLFIAALVFVILLALLTLLYPWREDGAASPEQPTIDPATPQVQ